MLVHLECKVWLLIPKSQFYGTGNATLLALTKQFSVADELHASSVLKVLCRKDSVRLSLTFSSPVGGVN